MPDTGWGVSSPATLQHRWLLTGPATPNKDESRELPACRVQMIALGRDKSSDIGRAEAMCKGVMASRPAPVDMVEGLEPGEAPVSICFWLSTEPIRNVSLLPDCSSVLLICSCINSCCYYTAR